MRYIVILVFFLASCHLIQSGPGIVEKNRVDLLFDAYYMNLEEKLNYDSLYTIKYPIEQRVYETVVRKIPWDTTLHLARDRGYYVTTFDQDSTCSILFTVVVKGDTLQPFGYGNDVDPCVMNFTNRPGNHHPWASFPD